MWRDQNENETFSISKNNGTEKYETRVSFIIYEANADESFSASLSSASLS